jgi:hypothetical protein
MNVEMYSMEQRIFFVTGAVDVFFNKLHFQ